MGAKWGFKQRWKAVILICFGPLWFLTTLWSTIAFYAEVTNTSFIFLSVPWWAVLITSVLAFVVASVGLFGLKKFRWSGNYQLIWWGIFFLYAIFTAFYLIYKLAGTKREFSLILTTSVLIIINLMVIFEHRFKYYLQNWSKEEYRDNLKQELALEVQIVKNLLIYSRYMKELQLNTMINDYHLEMFSLILNGTSLAALFSKNNNTTAHNHTQSCWEIFTASARKIQVCSLFKAFQLRQAKMVNYRLNNNWQEWDNHYEINVKKCDKIKKFFQLVICLPNLNRRLTLHTFFAWTHLIEGNLCSHLPSKPKQLKAI